MCWPLLIVAGLLPAAVEGHHSVAFTSHILVNYPLSGVAGTSPEEHHSFFQLHSVETESTFSRTCLLMHKDQEDTHFSHSLDCTQLIHAWQLRPQDNDFFSVILSSNPLSRWSAELSCLQKMSQLFALFWSHCLFPKRTAGFFFFFIRHVFSYVFHILIRSFKT